MSLRVIRNRERQKVISATTTPNNNNNHNNNIINNRISTNRTLSLGANGSREVIRSKSCPELCSEGLQVTMVGQRSSKSDSDLRKLIEHANEKNFFANAKSEVCLKTISVHTMGMNPFMPCASSTPADRMFSGPQPPQQSRLGTARSAAPKSTAAGQFRRHSTRSSNSYSSTDTMSRSTSMQSANGAYSNAIRVPIIGYEVMEERARFTVFKLRVENPYTSDCWLVLRRYTDFQRLHGKLKTMFPTLNVSLPKKRLFGDNFNNAFLDSRVQGLQQFVNKIMGQERLRSCTLVREFFCLDEPPAYSESVEECRAIFEAQVETIAQLKQELRNKDVLLATMDQKLKSSLDTLQEHLKHCTLKTTTPTTTIYNTSDIRNNNVQ